MWTQSAEGDNGMVVMMCKKMKSLSGFIEKLLVCIKRVPSQQSHSIIYPGAKTDKYDNIGVLNPNQMRR